MGGSGSGGPGQAGAAGHIGEHAPAEEFEDLYELDEFEKDVQADIDAGKTKTFVLGRDGRDHELDLHKIHVEELLKHAHD
ncbi:MAG: hypothetical protein WCE44_10460 [Candidatus Velthaea sp.]|jgi:hypothetical protein